MGWKDSAIPVNPATSWKDSAIPADSTTQPSPSEDPGIGTYLLGAGRNLVENAENTFSGKNLSNIYATVGHGIDKVLPKSMESGLSYTQMRDLADKRLKNQSEEFPEAAVTGKIGGMGAQMYGLGKLGGLVGKGAGLVGKLLTPAAEIAETAPETAQIVKSAPGIIKRVLIGGGKGAGGAGLLAAAENPGNVEGQVTPLQLDERLSAAKKAAPWGFGLGSVAGAITGENASNALRSGGKNFAFDASRPSLKNINQLDYAYSDPSKLKDKMSEIGETLLDHNLVDGKPKGSLNLSIAVKNKMRDVGQKFGDYMQLIKNTAQQDPKAPQVGIDVDKIGNYMGENLKQKSPFIESTTTHNQTIDDFVSHMKNKSGGKLTIEEAEILKGDADADRLANWNEKDSDKVTDTNRLFRSLSTAIKSQTEEAADKTIDYLQKNRPDLLPKDFSYEDFLKTKKDYGNLKWLGDVTLGRAKRDLVNRSSGLSDYLSGIGGGVAAAASGHPAIAAPAAVAFDLANKGARLYGSQVMANGLNKASGLLRKPVPNGLISPIANQLKGSNE